MLPLHSRILRRIRQSAGRKFRDLPEKPQLSIGREPQRRCSLTAVQPQWRGRTAAVFHPRGTRNPVGRRSFIINFFTVSVILIFLFIFITGFHDEGNLIATIISSRSMNVILIFALAFFSQFAGTCLLGTRVAHSMVYQLFNVPYMQQDPHEIALMIFSSMLGATTWNIITWIFGIPSSSSNAIIGGLMGPFVMKFGFSVINVKGLLLGVLLPIFTSPLIGFTFGYLIFRLNEKLFCGRSIRIKKLFQGLQGTTCVLINAFQGSNDAQKSLGVLALLLMATNGTWTFSLPENVTLLAALAISFGLVLGGTRMIKNVGTRIYSVKSLHSMSAQTSSLIVIGLASFLGFPVSGTQIVNSSIFGVGAADRPNAVGWLYAKDMVATWFTTIPISFLISSGFYWIFHWIGG